MLVLSGGRHFSRIREGEQEKERERAVDFDSCLDHKITRSRDAHILTPWFLVHF